MSETKVDESLDYSKIDHTYGTYQLTRVVQQTGLQTFNITTAGGQESIFEIPPKVVNFSKSFIEANLSIPNGTAANIVWTYADGFTFIRQIQLYTRSGLYLCDINDLDRYTNMTFRKELLNADVLGFDRPSAVNAATISEGYFEGLIPLNPAQVATSRPAYGAAYSVGLISMFEPQYMLISGASAGADDKQIINIRFGLDKILNTILSNNKDLYFGGEIVYIRIVWNPLTKIYFTGTSATNPRTATAAAADNISVDNLLLMLAVETNPLIENLIKSKVASPEGLQILTPMVYYNKVSLATASTNHTITTRYNRAQGLKLKKIYWSAYDATFNDALTANYAYNHSCIPTFNAGVYTPRRIQDFYTMLNNIRTSQYNYTISTTTAFKGDDWKAKKESLKGACIFSMDEYYYNWVWVEDFTDNNSLFIKSTKMTDNYSDGIDLTNEIKYDIYSTVAAVNANGNAGVPTSDNIEHYVYAVTEKLLIINSAGVTFV